MFGSCLLASVSYLIISEVKRCVSVMYPFALSGIRNLSANIES